MHIRANVAYSRISAEGVKFVRENGLYPEIYISDSSELGSEEIAKLCAIVKECGPESTVHAPFSHINIGNEAESARQYSLKQLLDSVRIASGIGSSVMVVHPGYHMDMTASETDDWFVRADDSLNKLVSLAESLHITLAFENIFDREPSVLMRLVKTYESSFVKICFDVGHCNIFGTVPQQKWLDTLEDLIVECHLHDNDKTGDQHRSIGTGSVDFEGFARWYCGLPENKKPILTLEHRSADNILTSLASLRKLGILKETA